MVQETGRPLSAPHGAEQLTKQWVSPSTRRHSTLVPEPGWDALRALRSSPHCRRFTTVRSQHERSLRAMFHLVETLRSRFDITALGGGYAELR
ncbi:hypothetical protein AAFF_G00236170 [Aldrovandia affinis]|uniref:Uncharacterized protein n=1 Tax=Aldrovandia affinis TaxID=143900 RepID=A0AAD7W3X0_9TELE|nr:hypothetical protein AAFF_G00236170 [Aldrovandia affinis]